MQINWQRARDISISLVCIGLILWAAWSVAGQFVDIIVILLLSMGVAFLVSPAVDVLAKYHVPRVLGTLVVFVVVLAVVSGIAYGLVFTLIVQAQRFSDTITNFATHLPSNLSNFIIFVEKQTGIPDTSVQSTIAQISTQATDFARGLATNIVGLVLGIGGALLNIFLVIVLSFYLILDGKRIRDSLISIVPRRSLPHVLLFEDALNRVVGNYIRGQLTLALIVGVLASFVCVITGLKEYALLVGVLAFLFETIPMVGPGLASIAPIVLSLLLPEAFPRTFYVIAWFVVIQVIESNILGPRIVGHAVGLHPVASVVALLVGAKLFGAFGALLATPIVAAIWVVIASFYRSLRGETADQILSRRRAPWTFRRPGGGSPGRTTGRLPAMNGEQVGYGEYSGRQPREAVPEPDVAAQAREEEDDEREPAAVMDIESEKSGPR